mgnify:CR=1 FL=1
MTLTDKNEMRKQMFAEMEEKLFRKVNQKTVHSTIILPKTV